MKIITSATMWALILTSAVWAMSIVDAVQVWGSNESSTPKRAAIKVEWHREVINEWPAYLPSRNPNPHYNYPNNNNRNNNFNNNGWNNRNNNNNNNWNNNYFYSGKTFINQSIISNYTIRNQIANTTLYQVNNRYIAINHQNSTILFETPSNRTLLQSIVESGNSAIIFRNNSTKLYEIYFKVQGYSSHVSDISQYNYYQSKNNSENMFILKIVNNRLNSYSMFDLTNFWISSSLSTSTLDSEFEQYLRQPMVNSSNVINYNSLNNNQWSQFFPQWYYPNRNNNFVNQPNYVITNPYDIRPTTPDPVLTYRINYTLWARDNQWFYPLRNPTCSTNGSIEQFYIAKRPGDLSYGIGTEITTYGSTTNYRVKNGDQICCTVILSRNTYQKAWWCQVVQI